MKSNEVSAADIETCLHPLYERDYQLEKVAKEILSEDEWLKIFAGFNIHPTKSNAQYKLFCPNCNQPDAITLSINGQQNFPTFSCKCAVQKIGNTIIDLIHLFTSAKRSAIINCIKSIPENRKIRMKRAPQKIKMTGVYKIS